jgi:hypothetical protein
MRNNNIKMIAVAIAILGLLYYFMFMQDSGCMHCKKGSEVATSMDWEPGTTSQENDMTQEDEYFQEDEYLEDAGLDD